MACQFVAHLRLTGSLDVTLRSIDLDDQRIQLIDEMIIVFLGALTTAMLVRKPLATFMGASLYALVSYIGPFVQHAQQISTSVTGVGVTQTIPPGALQHVTTILAALCVLAAILGAAIGVGVGAVTIGPILDLYRTLWALVRHAEPRPSKTVPLRAAGALAVALALVVLLSLASASGPLWAFGIDSSLFSIQQPTSLPGESSTGTVAQGTYFSAALGRKMPYMVYLPPSYTIAAAERYPTFYLLHGAPGAYSNWLNAGSGGIGQVEDALLASGKMHETIVACPDGNGAIYGYSQWINSFDGRQHMEDAVLDFVRFIDAAYRTIPDPADRAIGGISEGGYGAVNLALHHPDVFGDAASVGGYYEILPGPAGLVGGGSAKATFQRYNSPGAYLQTTGGAAAARALRYVISVDTVDGSFYTDGINFSKLLRNEHLAVQFLSVVGGHQWSVFRVGLVAAFQAFDPPDTTTTAPTQSPTHDPTKSPTPTKRPN